MSTRLPVRLVHVTVFYHGHDPIMTRMKNALEDHLNQAQVSGFNTDVPESSSGVYQTIFKKPCESTQREAC